MNFQHISVLLKECIDNLNIKPDGVYIDGTLGGAGHSHEIVKQLNDNGTLIGIDQDQNALNAAREKLTDSQCNIKFVHDNFKNLEKILSDLKIMEIDGLLLDLGVSSHQLDIAERGFSYMQDGPLDMRMNIEQDFTAKDIVNEYSKEELYRVLWEYGEEKWAKRIAEFIVKYRKNQEINTTYELVDIIKRAIPKGARRDGPHPAKRSFQGIRIEVNSELSIIDRTIKTATKFLRPGGRICIITFHSLEDRIVKNTYRNLQNPCKCPPEFPICQCNKVRELKVITRKPILPSKEELEINHRSRSAKLRVAEKV